MKPAPFDYAAASSVDEAVMLLEQYGDEAKLLAGGQSLVPLMNFRLVRPGVVIDLNPITSLAYIRQEDGWLRIGALTRDRAIEDSSLVRAACPILAEATRWIGHRAIRHRGTIGGSLAHNDPAAEYPLVAALLDARLVAVGAAGARTIAAAGFAVDYLTTALAPGEMLTEIQLPTLPSNTGWSFREVARRHGDFAIVAVGAVLAKRGDEVEDVKIAVGGAGPVAARFPAAEAALKRRQFSPEAIQAASQEAADACRPEGDLHASADYRKHLVRVLVREALEEAWNRA